MTRTLWVTTDFPPRPGGIEQSLANLLARRPPQATWVLAAPWPGGGQHDATLPYRVDRIGRRPLLPTPALRQQVKEAADAHAADVVLLGPAWPLGELAGRVGRPTIALSYGHEAGMVRIGLGPLIRRLRRATVVTVISAFTRSLLEPWLSPHTRVELLPPGVDVDVFHPGVEGTCVRARYGIAADRPLVVCISRLVPRKGQDVLIEVWPRVTAAVPGAHLLIAGVGPREAVLRSRVRQLGLHRDVTLAGELAWGDLPAYYAAGDVFAMPCRTRLGGLDVEGLGMVYLEAQACGVPVVAGRSGGAPEAVVDGETGHVVDGANPAAVTGVIISLLRDPDRRAAMGAAGRAFVERHWSWSAISHRLDELLADLSGHHDGARQAP
ncbi:MAG: glycosyltransferase family 4 protein [Egibacteraceae bacterium]